MTTHGMRPSPADDPLDRELVQRVQKGDKRSFDLLVRKYQHKIVKLIGRYVSDPQAVLDVAQDTFLRAYRALRHFRGDSAFYTWLYRIAVNSAKNHLVAEARHPAGEDIDSEENEHLQALPALRESDTPERLLFRDELLAAIRGAIGDLPEDLRTAITLREMEGLSYDQIAEIMSCPVGTVRSRIFRAREAIDERIRPLLDGGWRHEQ